MYDFEDTLQSTSKHRGDKRSHNDGKRNYDQKQARHLRHDRRERMERQRRQEREGMED